MKLPITLAGLFFLSCAAAGQDAGTRAASRLSPPAGVSCNRNQLTSWTGEISGYRRSENHTWLQVSTDYDTLEQIVVEHDEQSDPTTHYLLWGEPFTGTDWTLIESSAGVLIAGMRATVWICEDGVTPPVVDWQPPPK